MERSPRIVKDSELSPVFDYIFRNAMGNPIIFTAAPTLAQMKASTWGIYGTTIYLKFSNATGITISGTTLS